jgi:hypothetical protein
MVLDDGTSWVTVSEASRRLGVTRAAIRKRIARGALEAHTDNRGNPLVRLPGTKSEVPSGTGPKVPDGTILPVPSVPPGTSASVPGVSVLMVPASMLAEAIAQERAETARQLAARDSLHLDTLGRLQAQAAAERSLWLERIDAAELRSERLEQRLDQVLDQLLADRRQPVALQVSQGERAPWWRRWFGTSTKSKIGRP